MNKCGKCGKEFEGKFCPECGTRVCEGEDLFEFEERQELEVQTVSAESPKERCRSLAFLTKISGSFLWFAVAAVVLFAVCAVVLASKSSRTGITVNDVPVALGYYTATACLTGVAGIASVIMCVHKILKKRPLLSYSEILRTEKAYQKALGLIAIPVVLFIAIIIFRSSVITVSSQYKPTGAEISSLVFAIILVAGFTGLCVAGLIAAKTVKAKYISLDADGRTVSKLTPLVEQSAAEIQNSYVCKFQAVNSSRAGQGKPAMTEYEYKRRNALTAILFYAVLFAVTAGIFLLCVLVPKNIFNLKTVDKVCIGDSADYVYRILGEPYDKFETTNESGTVVAGIYTYCNSRIASELSKVNKMLEKLIEADDADLEKIMKYTERALTLEIELAQTKADYINISVTDGRVSSLSYDKDVYYLSPETKAVKNITYAVDTGNYDDFSYCGYSEIVTLKNNEKIKGVNAKLYFTDGSFENVSLGNIIGDTLTTGVHAVKWNDGYGTHILNVIIK